MTLDTKLLIALLDLLSEGKPVNKNSLCVRSGVNRGSLHYRLQKHKSFIDVEVLDHV